MKAPKPDAGAPQALLGGNRPFKLVPSPPILSFLAATWSGLGQQLLRSRFPGAGPERPTCLCTWLSHSPNCPPIGTAWHTKIRPWYMLAWRTQWRNQVEELKEGESEEIKKSTVAHHAWCTSMEELDILLAHTKTLIPIMACPGGAWIGIRTDLYDHLSQSDSHQLLHTSKWFKHEGHKQYTDFMTEDERLATLHIR
eukprot:55364-Pelagomonas_calceolata.AAC.6